MPDWLPWVIGLGGGGGVGALITALVNMRSSLTTQMNAFIDQLQEDRKADRESVNELKQAVSTALLHLQVEREYSADLYIWAVNGAPPPPPARRTITPPSM